MNSLKELSATIEELEADLHSYEDVSKAASPKVWCFTGNDEKYLVLATEVDGKNRKKKLNLKDANTEKILLKLIRKRCYERKLHNLGVLKRAYSELIRDDVSEAVDWIVQKYEPLTHKYILELLLNSKIDDGDITTRAEKHKNDKYNNREIIAVTGQKVKSKSEGWIISELEKHNIMYKYEHNFKINGFEISPDFFIVRGDGEFIIWEHFGKMDDSSYLRRQQYKLKDYLKAGFVPWDNMILTFDGPDGIIDAREIAFKIEQKLL